MSIDLSLGAILVVALLSIAVALIYIVWIYAFDRWVKPRLVGRAR